MNPPKLPHNHNTEAAVLGSVLNWPAALRTIASLEVEDFAHPKHQAVFAAIRNLEAAGSSVDPITVEAELARVGKSESLGGLAFLAQLSMSNFGGGHADDPALANYVETLTRLRVKRDTMMALSEAMDALADPANEDDLDGEAATQYAIAALQRVNTRTADTTSSIGDIVVERMRQLHRIAEERESGRVALTGFPTGVLALDRILGGWQSEILHLVGARPGMGKSSMLLATVDACTEATIGTHSFILEDSRASQADRAIARLSEVPAKKLRSVELNRQEFLDIQNAVTRLRQRQGWIVEDKTTLTAEQIVRAVRRRAEKNKTRVVIVDYIQLVKKRDWRMSEHEHLDEVSTTFMRAAKEDGMAYVVASQLNRECERRPNKRPTMADLRASGALEERAKCVVFPYRGSQYGDAVEGIDYEKGEGYPSDWETRIEYLVEKNSNGETGRVLGTWDGPTMRAA